VFFQILVPPAPLMTSLMPVTAFLEVGHVVLSFYSLPQCLGKPVLLPCAAEPRLGGGENQFSRPHSDDVLKVPPEC